MTNQNTVLTIIPLQVLQEAEEQSVHRHVVDSEEGAGNDVTTHHNEDNRSDRVVQGGNLLLQEESKLEKKRSLRESLLPASRNVYLSVRPFVRHSKIYKNVSVDL